jgi:hypothetical protein
VYILHSLKTVRGKTYREARKVCKNFFAFFARFAVKKMVGRVGLEPTRAEAQRFLRPPRKPIPPSPR